MKTISELLHKLPLNNLSVTDRDRLCSGVFLYLLKQIKTRELARLARDLGVSKEVLHLRTKYLDPNKSRTSDFWKAAYTFFTGSSTIGKLAKKYKIDSTDLAFAIELLNSDPKFKTNIAEFNTKNPCLDEKHRPQVYDKLLKWIGSYVNFKMRFILNAHHELEAHDLVSDLFLEVYNTSLRYQYDIIQDNLLYLNVLKSIVKQLTVNKIMYYTSKKRARVVSVDSRSGDDPQYQLTTLSLDYTYGEGVYSGEAGKLPSLYDCLCVEDNTVESKSSMDALMAELEPGNQRFVRVVLGEEDKEFDNLLYSKYSKTNKKLTNGLIFREAKKFFNLTRADIARSILRPVVNAGMLGRKRALELGMPPIQ